jgi:hypothetical protein
MPTNLPPDAKKKWAEVEETRNPRERIQRMEEFLSLVPKHKGTLKLRGQVKKQMAALRKEIEEKKRKKPGKSGPKLFIEKEGAAQIVLVGLTKAGRSSLLAAVTNAKAEVSSNLYTTREPIPGVMDFKDIQFQIIESPALMEGSADGRAWGLQTLALARNADGLILMVDLSWNPVEQLSLILSELERAKILVSKPKARVDIDRKYMGAGLRIILVGTLLDCAMKEVEALLKSYHIVDAIVKISGEATLDEVEEAVFGRTVYKPSVIIANKIDLEDSNVNLKLLEDYVQDKLPILAISCERRIGLGRIGETLYRTLDIMRVYTKEPNERKFSRKPFILKKGSTVCDLAKSIHTDFSRNFSFAKIWAKRLVFSPQKVGSTFALDDEDVVEIHVK